MKNTNTIWISSAPRTGSMWIFNVVREINRILGFEVNPKIVPQKDSEMFKIYHNKAINETNKNIKYILKVHAILKPDLPRSKIITTIRDPRDLCISFKQFMKSDFEKSLNAAKSLISFYKIYKNFDKNYLLTLKYENIEKKPNELILQISNFLNFNISKEQANDISNKFSRDNVIKIVNRQKIELEKKILKKSKIEKEEIVVISNENVRAFDKNTGFQTGHISQRKIGDWEKEFSNEEKKILDKEFKNWLYEFGYL
tara:strand:+ start:185 stop:952 length:768 start_codon:yes stop_codon:yes gene_type:complete